MQTGTKQPEGTGILFIEEGLRVLLFLRDDKPNIPYPSCWDIPGGKLEEHETPEACIRREMQEEIGVALSDPHFFCTFHSDGIKHHIFWHHVTFNPAMLKLTEGQRLAWFSEEEVRSLDSKAVAFQFKAVLLNFFDEKPFRC